MKISFLRAAAEIVAVLTISIMALIYAAAAWGPYASAFGMLAGVAAAIVFIRLRGERLSDFGFRAAPILKSFLAIAAILAVAVALFVYIEPSLERITGPVDLSFFAPLEGNAPLYTLMLLVSWIGAGFGEEVVWRGFVMTRMAQAFSGSAAGWGAAIFLQAILFTFLHAYQDLTGMIEVFVIGIALGAAYLFVRRSLWPLIVAHGLIDTFVMTDFYFGMKYTEALRALF
ncbi:CPBP family intramembrane glutamic endopeptidase [Hyphococcus sp.]|uniref:CPBP family intramembrane glutamic endopeptidase n=1 Tax=Hyphococcus sp. TaxID=2038636 RepID=UPI003CCB7BEE